MTTTAECRVCHKKVEHWINRENKIYCPNCFKGALDKREGLSTNPNEEANPRDMHSEDS